jgi:predicted nucleotidyltransferase
MSRAVAYAYAKVQAILRGNQAMHALIEQHRAAIADICRRFGVQRLEVFCSAARAMDFRPDTSDADFLVEFAPGNGLPFLRRYFGLQDALSHLLGRPIDLVEPGAVRNPFVRASIDRAREIVYGS